MQKHQTVFTASNLTNTEILKSSSDPCLQVLPSITNFENRENIVHACACTVTLSLACTNERIIHQLKHQKITQKNHSITKLKAHMSK